MTPLGSVCHSSFVLGHTLTLGPMEMSVSPMYASIFMVVFGVLLTLVVQLWC